MKIGNETIEILSNYSSINNSIVIRQGNKLVTKTDSNTMLACAVTNDMFPREFAVYDLGKFLGVVKLLNEPELDFKEKQVFIKSGESVTKFTFCDPSMVKSPDRDSLNLEYTVEFDITSDALQKLTRAATVLRLDAIAIVGDGLSLTIEAIHRSNMTADSYSVMIGKTQKTFKMVIDIDYINKLMVKNYHVSLSPTGAVRFESDNITYWIAVNINASDKGNL